MLTINKEQLHSFLYHEAESYDQYKENAVHDDGSETDYLLTDEQWQYLKGCTFKQIVTGIELSENHLGGDDIVGFVDETLDALKEGFQICTWYGPDAEALVVGYRAQDITVIDPPEPVEDTVGYDQDGEPVTSHSTGHPACPAVNGGVCPIHGHNETEDDTEDDE